MAISLHPRTAAPCSDRRAGRLGVLALPVETIPLSPQRRHERSGSQRVVAPCSTTLSPVRPRLDDGKNEKLAAVDPDFRSRPQPLVPDEIRWSMPDHSGALEAQREAQVESTTV
jgi:hypothetical protein